MYFTYVIAMTKNEKYKVYAMHPNGKPRSNNTYALRPVHVPKQPKHGFETIEEAEKLMDQIKSGCEVQISSSIDGRQYLPIVPSSRMKSKRRIS